MPNWVGAVVSQSDSRLYGLVKSEYAQPIHWNGN